ncbi:DVL family protein [Ostertagia ostertagi]
MKEKSRTYILSVCALMLITGSLNTICAKWTDKLEAEGKEFHHPFLQAGCMFIGEILCLGAFFIVHGCRKYHWNKEKQNSNPDDEPRIPRFNPFVFLPATFCDIIATSISYVGLTLTSASSYQMLRGALIVCTGLLSILWLRARIKGFQWSGMLLCVLGLVVIGITDIYYSGEKPGDILCTISQVFVAMQLVSEQKYMRQYDVDPLLAVGIEGDILCTISQVFVAMQLVSEQKYMRQYDVDPLLAVGIEGIFGIIILCIALVPMYYIHVPPTFSSNPEYRLEDAIYAWSEICKQPMIAVSLTGMLIR